MFWLALLQDCAVAVQVVEEWIELLKDKMHLNAYKWQ